MQLIRPTMLTTLFLLPTLSLCAQTGHWNGKIEMGKRDLSITVNLAKTSGGAWIGTMSVAASSAVDVPLDNLAVAGNTLRFTANLPTKASFAGTIAADTLAGTASNAEGEVPFQLKRTGEAKVNLPAPSTASSKDFEGTWEAATTGAGGKVHRIILKLATASDGTAIATLISVDNGNMEIPVNTVTMKDKELRLESRAVSGAYQGTLGAAGEIAGEWKEGSTRVVVTFKRAQGP